MQPRSPRGRGNFCRGASGDATFRRNPLATCIVRFYGTPWRRSTARAAVGTEFLPPYPPHTHGDTHIPTAESRADLSNARNGGLITPVASLGLSAPGGKSTEVRPTDKINCYAVE